jgi:RHS repeat-associated protein
MQRGTLNSQHSALNSTTFGQCWTLDATGNWKGFRQDDDGDGTWDLAQQRSANAVNEITGVTETVGPSWATPGYDAAGNMTTVPQPADPTASYTATYDAWNRLVKLEEEVSGSSSSSSGGSLQAVQENQYDARRYRTVRKDYSAGVLDETRHFYYAEQWQSVEERVGSSSTAERQHVWGLRYIDDLVKRERDTDGNGALDESLYTLQDANWNVSGVVSSIYDALERYAYKAYGEPAVLDEGFVARSGSNYTWEYGFRCRERDGISGLHYFRGRHYDAGVGRFLGRDPLAYSDGANLYAAYFVPHGVDPFGMDCWPGGGWNPLNWYRGLVTGDFSAPEHIYQGALDSFGQDYTHRAGNAHHALGIISDWDPTPVSGWTNDALIGLEGPALNNAVMQNANPALGQAAQASEAASNAIGILKTLKDLKRGRLGVSSEGKNEGIYQFPDQTAGGKPYVGQSANMPQRLNRHEASGRLKRGTETTTPVSGGKAAREVAEQECIQDLTGGQKAKNSTNVANQRDPIGPNRRPGLGLPEPRD